MKTCGSGADPADPASPDHAPPGARTPERCPEVKGYHRCALSSTTRLVDLLIAEQVALTWLLRAQKAALLDEVDGAIRDGYRCAVAASSAYRAALLNRQVEVHAIAASRSVEPTPDPVGIDRQAGCPRCLRLGSMLLCLAAIGTIVQRQRGELVRRLPGTWSSSYVAHVHPETYTTSSFATGSGSR